MRIGWILGVFALAIVLAASMPSSATAQLVGSDHDFTAAGGNPPFNGAARICETCHSPHNTGSPQLIWNHTLSANTLTFGTGNTTNAGTTLPTDIGNWRGSTKFCLSCHDGSVAVGSMITGTWGAGEKITDADHVIAPGGSLVGNHPVAVPYPYQANAQYNSITSKADPNDYIAAPAAVKIYEYTASERGIECASCHNPHGKNTVGPFLRSGFSCTDCHNL